MTREEFIEAYCKRSNCTYEWLQSKGQEARPCHPDCEYEACEGWVMVTIEHEKMLEAIRKGT